MDSSKILEGTGECSSSESGWTTYIASPVEDDEHDHTDYDDDDDAGSVGVKAYKKVAEEDADNVDSDDSMASDASSGPIDQGHLLGRSCGFGHAGNRDERKYVGKKHNLSKLIVERMSGHQSNISSWAPDRHACKQRNFVTAACYRHTELLQLATINRQQAPQTAR